MVPVADGNVMYYDDHARIVAERDRRIAELERDARLWAGVHEEVHRRAEKECCIEDRRDFQVWVTHDQYTAIDAAIAASGGGEG